MDLSAHDYAAQLRALLPGGPAWADALTQKFLDAWAEEFRRLDSRITKLLNEADVRTTDEVLSEWEALLGLPDSCTTNVDLSVQERRTLAWRKLTQRGGQSRAYFIALAEALGVPGCTITEQFGGNPHHWRMTVPLPVTNSRYMTCLDDCTSPLQTYTPNLIECPIRKLKPAHTEVFFSYTG
jgi:uncharacterized protein YmfQ (DUF2313 family)